MLVHFWILLQSVLKLLNPTQKIVTDIDSWRLMMNIPNPYSMPIMPNMNLRHII